MDTITVRMEFTDETIYSGAPGSFNNGITEITCRVDLSIYANSSLWDYQVTLVNNRSQNVNYEYWTCTTLAPGSEPDDTGTPLNSEIIVPIEEYTAGWSPNAWIGSNNSTQDFKKIDYLSDWIDMGIAYAKDFKDNFWGVINHENEEGIFRISDNIQTKGVKLWTWGKNNIDNDLFDFSNGGEDNYIEIWAGVSNTFFSDAVLAPFETKTWNESYCATVNMSAIDQMNASVAINLIWDESTYNVGYELNTFQSDQDYTVRIKLNMDQDIIIAEESISFNKMGHSNTFSLNGLTLPFDTYLLTLEILDSKDNLILNSSESISAGVITSYEDPFSGNDQMIIQGIDQNTMRVLMPKTDQYMLKVTQLNGQTIKDMRFTDNTIDLHIEENGLIIIHVRSANARYSTKLLLR
jgi:hypothetical protein